MKPEKSAIGPGYLKDLESSYNSKSLSRRSPEPFFPKAKLVNYFHQKANSTKYVPGVGSYKDSEKAYTSNAIWHKSRVPFISTYKFTRFTESSAKEKQWIPGPGSYSVTPYSKEKSKD
jgi:hypothetical protein